MKRLTHARQAAGTDGAPPCDVDDSPLNEASGPSPVPDCNPTSASDSNGEVDCCPLVVARSRATLGSNTSMAAYFVRKRYQVRTP